MEVKTGSQVSYLCGHGAGKTQNSLKVRGIPYGKKNRARAAPGSQQRA